MLQPLGEVFNLKTSNDRHFGVMPAQSKPGDFMAEFTKAVGNAVENVNEAGVHASNLSMQMIRKPDSVDVHDVMIAGEEAQLAISLTKQVLSKVIEAYKTLENLR